MIMKINITADDQIAQRFRITTNGLRFRVENLCRTGMLWWKGQEWCTVYTYQEPTELPTLESAQVRLDNCIRELKAEMHGWQPVQSEKT